MRGATRMTAEELTKEEIKELYEFQQSLTDTAWKMYWEREAMDALKENIKKNETIRGIFAQIVYEAEKFPRKERPTLIMTRPLFEFVFKSTLDIFKDKPPKPQFMGKDIKIVDVDESWWAIGKSYEYLCINTGKENKNGE